MFGRTNADRQWGAFTVVAIAALMVAAWMVGIAPSSAAPAPVAPHSPAVSSAFGAGLAFGQELGGEIFAKYDGIDGESLDENHDGWVDVGSFEWGAQRPETAAQQSRRRAAAEVDDVVLTFDYEKASPKLVEKLLTGAVIPKLELEFTSTYGGARATYLKYELRNVQITSYSVNAAEGFGPPTVVFGHDFEEIKVTYTEYDDEGNSQGNVEYEYQVEKGN